MSRERYEACCRESNAICSELHLNSKLLRRVLSELRVVVFASTRAPHPKQEIRRTMLVRPHAHQTVFASSISPLELSGQKPPAENCASSRQLQRPRLTHMGRKHAFK